MIFRQAAKCMSGKHEDFRNEDLAGILSHEFRVGKAHFESSGR